MTSRWNQQLSVPVAQTIRAQWAAGRVFPAQGWAPEDVLAVASGVCREHGLVGAPGLVMRVAAAVNCYSKVFLPWSWRLDPGADTWDERALSFRRGDQMLVDFLWAEPWDVPLPRTAHFAEVPGRVRMLDLLRPQASREYIDGRHSALRMLAVR